MSSRVVVVLLSLLAVLLMASCAGGTDPASNVTNVSAQLNAHGYSNDGPATWWWEYDTVQSDLGTANDTEVCGVGAGPKEADKRCGPATGGSQSSTIPLNVVVTALTPDTTYYFRACGQDTNDPAPTCANTRSFETLAGTSYVFDRKWGTRGTFNGQFQNPFGVALDSSDRVYVAEQGNRRIQKFTSKGEFLTGWGTPGTGDGQFGFLSALAAANNGNVYTGELYPANRVQKFTSTGGFVTKWGSTGNGDGVFADIRSLATDAQGDVYVGDNVRIEKYTSQGAFITAWGDSPTNGYFNGLAADETGHVYAVDDFARVYKFTANGGFVTRWDIIHNSYDRFPTGAATDSAGNVYASVDGNDAAIAEIQKFSPTGTLIARWGSGGSGDGQFGDLGSLAVDSLGNVYVADAGNDRIQKFKPVE